MHGLAVCAGFGGLELGLRLVFGRTYRTICFLEREAFAAAGLVALMEAGLVDEAPVWDDLATFDGRPWRGRVDIVSAGLPCQPYSVAGLRRGHEDERAIWPRFVRLLRQVRPTLVLIENVAPFLAWYRPLGDRLSRLGYEYQVGLFRASEVGAPQRRERLFILAYTRYRGRERHRERDGNEVRFATAFRRDADGCNPSLADAGCTRGSEVSRCVPGHEGKDEGRTVANGYESSSRGDAVADACCRQLPFAWRRTDGRAWSASAGGSLDGASGGFVSEPRACTRSAADAVVHTSRDGRREGRSKPAVWRWRAAPDEPGRELGDADRAGLERRRCDPDETTEPGTWPPGPSDAAGWERLLVGHPELAPSLERGVLRMADGMANRVDRLRGVGNGVVPLVAAYAFRVLAAEAGMDLQQLLDPTTPS